MSDKDLINKILDASNKIHKRTTRGAGSFMITSQAVSDMIYGISNKKSDRMDKIKRIFNV